MKYFLIIALLIAGGATFNAPMHHVVVDQALPKMEQLARDGFTQLERSEAVKHATAAILQWVTSKVQHLSLP